MNQWLHDARFATGLRLFLLGSSTWDAYCSLPVQQLAVNICSLGEHLPDVVTPHVHLPLWSRQYPLQVQLPLRRLLLQGLYPLGGEAGDVHVGEVAEITVSIRVLTGQIKISRDAQ